MFDITAYKDHPDHDLITEVFSACESWLESGEGFGVTSQITGDGAVRMAEEKFSALHGGNMLSLLLPSATYGLRVALQAAGVKAGQNVCVASYDWPAALAAVESVGAVPLFMPVDAFTFTLDPQAFRGIDLSKVAAIVTTHIHGVPADVPAIREVAGCKIPIIEDCSQALGSTLDGKMVGTLGDIAVFSFGPGKSVSTCEGGMIITHSWDFYRNIIHEAAHPVRQIHSGNDVNAAKFSLRPHPMTAIMLIATMRSFQRETMCARSVALAEELSLVEGAKLIGCDTRRQNASGKVPILLECADKLLIDRFTCAHSGAFDLELSKRVPSAKPVYIVKEL